MMQIAKDRRSCGISLVGLMVVLTILMVAGNTGARAQSDGEKPTASKPEVNTYETFYLKNLTQQSELNDIQTDLRNVLPRAKIYGMPTQQSISLWATPEDMAVARKIVTEFDRPRRSYRLTYTISEIESGKRIASQHYSLVVSPGTRTVLKQGRRLPLVTGTTDTGAPSQSSQVQYIDVGFNIDATLDGYLEGLRLKTKIEQSSVAEEKSGVGVQDPVILQTMLEGSSSIVPGKPTVLGAMDIPGTSRHEEVEVVVELVR